MLNTVQLHMTCVPTLPCDVTRNKTVTKQCNLTQLSAKSQGI